jgi:hypothetical protein
MTTDEAHEALCRALIVERFRTPIRQAVYRPDTWSVTRAMAVATAMTEAQAEWDHDTAVALHLVRGAA